MELSSTAYVVLGMLRENARTGYEIKQVVDNSTRFFWAASYGQIYPELKELAKRGLVRGESEPHGARKRTVYRLTPDGRDDPLRRGRRGRRQAPLPRGQAGGAARNRAACRGIG